MKAAFYSASNLKAAGFRLIRKAASYSASDQMAACYSASDLKAAVYTASDLNAAGHCASDPIRWRPAIVHPI